jgi:hypothetical protein
MNVTADGSVTSNVGGIGGFSGSRVGSASPARSMRQGRALFDELEERLLLTSGPLSARFRSLYGENSGL